MKPPAAATNKPTSKSTRRPTWTSTPRAKSTVRHVQPHITHRTGKDGKQYRQYAGYPGWYLVGVWPVGYGSAHGCTVPGQEGDGIDDVDDIFDGD
ncbi:hypothetical protein [Nonomuraea maheshkhaliensis]|uniref:hypothetical protein n=1 Tax=Nonomuraea maheshkhaliensis TaxID=419590 RepID=UPI0031F9F15A